MDKRVNGSAKRLELLRSRVVFEESRLREHMRLFLSLYGVRETARKLGIAPQYLCDVRDGRRRVSDELVRKILGKE